MPKTHPIPQLSIVVPIGRDLAGFEATLISVLENQPSSSEVLVPHDGTYDDPFDLCGEVRFVECDSTNPLELVASAASQARGRFVHVISDGLRATCGWTDSVLDYFDHFDTGVVSPVIRSHRTQRVIAAGWQDTRTRLCTGMGQGLESPDHTWRVGAYLQASFWRRDVLRSLHRAYRGSDSVEASFAFYHLLREAGWRSELAIESSVCCDSDKLPWDASSFTRGLRLRALHHYFVKGGWSQSIVAGSTAAIGSVFNPKTLAEAAGQAFASLAASELAALIRPDEVTACDDRGMIIALPKRVGTPLRRAA